jgi:hypothetical protein
VSVEQGRKRVRRGVHRPMAEWDVLIKDHHEGYINWEEFERNQSVIANNATGKGSAAVKGAVRRGELIDVGIGKGTLYNEYEFIGHGLRSDDRRARMAEAIEVLERA